MKTLNESYSISFPFFHFSGRYLQGPARKSILNYTMLFLVACLQIFSFFQRKKNYPHPFLRKIRTSHRSFTLRFPWEEAESSIIRKYLLQGETFVNWENPYFFPFKIPLFCTHPQNKSC